MGVPFRSPDDDDDDDDIDMDARDLSSTSEDDGKRCLLLPLLSTALVQVAW